MMEITRSQQNSMLKGFPAQINHTEAYQLGNPPSLPVKLNITHASIKTSPQRSRSPEMTSSSPEGHAK